MTKKTKINYTLLLGIKIYILVVLGHCLTEKGIRTKENLKIIKNNRFIKGIHLKRLIFTLRT